MKSHLYACILVFLVICAQAQVKDSTPIIVETTGSWVNTPKCVLPAGWEIQGASAPAVASSTYCYKCGNTMLLGGYAIMGNNAVLLRNYRNLAPHYQLSITFTFWKIDAWNSETMSLIVNTKTIVTQSFTAQQTSQICGNTGCPDAKGNCNNDLSVPFTRIIPHTGDSVTFQFDSTLVKTSDIESWGLSDYSMAIYPCDISCGQCSGPLPTQCTICAANLFLNTVSGVTTCVKTCPSGYYGDNVSQTHACAACSANCLSCSGPTDSNCLTCKPGFFFSANRCLAACPTGTYPDLTTHTCSTTCPTGTFANSAKGVCESCDLTVCKTCSTSSTTCATCNTGQFHYTDGKCYAAANCPAGTYADTANNQCSLCDASCASCSGPAKDQCLKCAANHYTVAGKPNICLLAAQCPTATFANSATFICTACFNGCLTCTGVGADQCSTCQTGYQHTGNSCIQGCATGTFQSVDGQKCVAFDQCGSGFYGEKTTNKCVACYAGCASCSGALLSQCLTCQPNFYFSPTTNSCVLAGQCPTGQFSDQYTSPKPFACVTSCGDSLVYGDTKTHQCMRCDASCASCSGPTPAECTKCYSPSHFLNPTTHQCITKCQDYLLGSYGNLLSTKCEACDLTCLTCSGPTGQNCLTCITGFSLVNGGCVKTVVTLVCNGIQSLYLGACVSVCPNGFYRSQITINGLLQDAYACSSCDTTCKTCVGSLATQCSSCNGQTTPAHFLYLIKDTDTTGTCVTKCPNNMAQRQIAGICDPRGCGNGYFQGNDQYCYACDLNCASCKIDPSNGLKSICLFCSGQFLLIGNSCAFTSCATATVPSYANLGVCTPCDAKCLGCETSGTKCISCKAGLTLDIKTSTCVALICDPLCSVCTGTAPNQCSVCASDAFLAVLSGVNTCVRICPSGYFGNLNTHLCSICFAGCASCTGLAENNCVGCNLGFFLSNNRCVTTCPVGSFPSQGSRTCILTCPTGTFPNLVKGLCETCDLTVCKTCSTSPTTCATCNGGLLHFTDGKCYTLTNCPVGTYADTVNSVCALCDPNCAACTGPSNDQCQKCNFNRFTLPNKPNVCVLPTQCPQGTFANPANQMCTLCSLGCLTCSGTGVDQCLTCLPDYQHLVNSCVQGCATGTFKTVDGLKCVTFDQCGSGFYGEKTTNKCVPCYAGCTSCSGALMTQCLGCITSLYYAATTNTCVQVGQCPNGQFSNPYTAPLPFVCTSNCGDRLAYGDIKTHTCQRCDTSCMSCTGPTINECTQCYSPKTFLNPTTHQCIAKCTDYLPNSYGSTTSTHCELCDASCLSCSGPSNLQCVTCALGFSLLNGACTRINVVSTILCIGERPLFNGACVDACPIGYFRQQNPATVEAAYICERCDTTCKTCVKAGANQCSSCSGSLSVPARFLYLINQDVDKVGTCVTQCPNNIAQRQIAGICDARGCRGIQNTAQFQGSDQNCYPCSQANCALCRADPTNGMISICESCISPLLLVGKVCATSCQTAPVPSYANAGVCTACDAKCLTCQSATHCLSCKAGLILDVQTSSCIALVCDALCSVCTGTAPNQCSVCAKNAFLALLAGVNTCVSSCPASFYPNLNSHACSACNANCYQCRGPSDTDCLECNQGFFLSNNKCVATCPTGSFPNQQARTCVMTCPTGTLPNMVKGVCEACDLNVCKTCSTSSTTCATCNAGLYHYVDGKCYTAANCPAGTYGNTVDSQCTMCDANCALCTGPSNEQCPKCNLNRYSLTTKPNVCVLQCPLGTFGNTANFVCTACHIGCQSCTGVGADQCLTCSTDYQRSGTSCVQGCAVGTFLSIDGLHCVTFDLCGSGFYGDKTTNKCVACYAGCVSCSGTLINQCLSCIPTLYFSPSTNTCVQAGQCPNNQYSNSLTIGQPPVCLAACDFIGVYTDTKTRQCLRCDASCIACSGPTSFECTHCKNTFLNPKTHQCIAKCSDYLSNSYGNTLTTQCELCDATCLTCSGPSYQQCLGCLVGATLTNGICVRPTVNIIGGTGNIVGEVLCIADTVLYNGVCVAACPSGFYKTQNAQKTSNICSMCDTTCKTCIGSMANQCSACFGGLTTPARFLYLINQDTDKAGTCVTQCPNGIAQRFAAGTCDARGCRTQFNYAQFQASDQFCYTCDLNCALCKADPANGMKSICETCSSPFVLIGNSCAYTTCATASVASFVNAGVCTPCDPKCLTCGVTAIKCLSCKPGQALDVTTNTCLSLCLVGQYLDVLTSRCTACSASCSDCFGPANNQCKKCVTPTSSNQIFTLDIVGGVGCYNQCPLKYYGDQVTHTCKLCYASCSICTGPTQNDCSYCGPGLILDGTSCVTSCPSNKILQNIQTQDANGLFVNMEVCVNCAKYGCATCGQVNGITVCLTCNIGLFLIDGQCGATCPVGFYKSSNMGVCTACQSFCKSCTDKNICQSCSSGFYYNSVAKTCGTQCPLGYFGNAKTNTCVEFCPDGFYANKILNLCSPCDPSCGTCYDATNEHCTSCTANQFTAFFTTQSNSTTTVMSPLYFPDQFIGAREYAVSGWMRWTSTAAMPDYSSLFRLTDVQAKQAGNDKQPGDRTLATWVGNDGNYLFVTYTCPTQDNSCNPNTYVKTPYGTALNTWTYIYYGYSKDKSQAYAYLQLKGVPTPQTQTQIYHFLPTTFLLTLGKDAFYPGFQGDLAGFTLNVGPGSYQEGGYEKSVGSINFGYTIGLQEQNQKVVNQSTTPVRRILANAQTTVSYDKQMSAVYDQAYDGSPRIEYSWDTNSATQTKAYGYGYWFRVLQRYPKNFMALAGQWQFLSKITTNAADGNLVSGDKALAVFSYNRNGQNYLHYVTDDGTNPDKTQDLPFPGDSNNVEGEWSYLYYSWSSVQSLAVVFQKISGQDLQTVSTTAVHKASSVLRFILGGTQVGFSSFNGQFANVYYSNIENEAFIQNSADLTSRMGTKFPRPASTWPTMQKHSPVDNSAPYQSDSGTFPANYNMTQKLAEEYSVSGWFKFVQPKVRKQHMMFRLTQNDPFKDNINLGDLALSAFVSTSTFHFSSYTYTNLFGAGTANDQQDIVYGDSLFQWNFIYMSYSRSARNVYTFVQFTDRVVELNKVTRQYLSPSLLFTTGQDGDTYSIKNANAYSGYISKLQCFYGPGAYSSYQSVSTSPTDLWQLKSGYSLYQQPTTDLTINANDYKNKILDSAYNQTNTIIVEQWGQDQLTATTKQYYGFGLWTRYLTNYPVRQLMGNSNNYNIIGQLTQNSPYTNGRNYGDKLLSLWMSDTGYMFTTYSTGAQLSVSATIPYPRPQTGLVEGVWVYLYICYSVADQTMNGFMKTPEITVMTTLNSISHTPVMYMKFILGGIQDQKDAFNGQFASPVFGLGSQYYLSTVDQLNKALVPYPQPADYTQSLATIQVLTTPQVQNGTLPMLQRSYNEEFYSEVSVSGWFKWTPPQTQNQWTLLFRLSSLSQAEVFNDHYNGDRDLAIWLGEQQKSYTLETYDYTNLQGQGEPGSTQFISYGSNLNNQWNYVYFGFSRPLRRAFGAVAFTSQTGTVLFQNIDHYLTRSVFFQLGNDIVEHGLQVHSPWSGSIGYVNINFGTGAYTEKPQSQQQNDIFAYSLGQKQFYPTTDIQTQLNAYDSPWQKTTPTLLKKEWQTTDSTMPKDVSEYGYGYWFRYTTLYPVVQPTGKSESWYIMSRMTTNMVGADFSAMGDRTLAIWQGTNYYYFATYDLTTNNYDLDHQMPFVGATQEGQWNFLTFSYSVATKQATAIVQYGNAEPIINNFANTKHLPLTNYLRFTLGQDVANLKGSSYSVMNGQFVNPIFGVGSGAYIGNVQDFKQLQVSKCPPPINYWASHPLATQNIDNDILTIKPTPPEKQSYYKFQVLTKLPEEYAISGWFKWTSIPDQQQWHSMFRVSVTRNDSNTDYQTNGARDLAVWVSKDPASLHFTTYSYTDLIGDGNDNVIQWMPYTTQLPMWHYVYFGYSRPLTNAYAFVQFKDTASSLNFPNINHYLVPQFSVYVGGDQYYYSYSGQVACVNFNMGPGAYRTTTKGLTTPDPFCYTQGTTTYQSPPQNFNPLITAQSQLYASQTDGSASVNNTWTASSLQDSSEFGYGYWARWLYTYPTRVFTSPDYMMVSNFQVNHDSSKKVGLYSLYVGIFGKQQKYEFASQDKASGTQVSRYVDFIGNQEGLWVFYYYSYSYAQKQGVGFINQGQANYQMVTVPAVNPDITGSAYLQIGGQFNQFETYQGLQGQIGNVVYGVGKGMFINTDAGIQAFANKNYKQLGDMITPLFFDPITTPAKNYTSPQDDATGTQMSPYRNVGFPHEYAVSGWFKWTPMVNRQEWHQMFRLTINSPGSLQDMARLGDCSLMMWAGKSCDCYQMGSYTYNIQNPDIGDIEQFDNIPTGVNLPTWAYVYMGYNRATWSVHGFVRWADHDGEILLKKNYQYLSNDFWLYLPNNPKYYPVFNGQIANVRAQFGPGSYVADNQFVSPNDRYRYTIGHDLQSPQDLQVYQPKDNTDVQYLTYDQTNAVYSNQLNDNGNNVKINGISEYGYGMWTRWSRTGPLKYIPSKAPWYFIGAIDNVVYSGAPTSGQNALSSYVGQGYYNFRGANIGTTDVSMNINYDNQLDGVWNFIYLSYLKTGSTGSMTGWVQFADGTQVSVSKPAAQNFVAKYLSFRVQSDPKYDGQNYLFNGYMTQIIFALGSGSYIGSKEALTQIINKYVPLPPGAILQPVQRISLNLLSSTSQHWCGNTCPKGYSESTDNNVRVCNPCSATCKTCNFNAPAQCTSCNQGYYLSGFNCVTTCPTGLIPSNLKQTCVDQCPSGTFQNLATNKDVDCQTCFTYCATCTGASNLNCLTCKLGYVLIGNTCSDKCQTGYYINVAVCAQCPSSCATCISPVNCQSCNLGSYLNAGLCGIICPDGYYGSNVANTCARCNAVCATCTGASPDQCLVCALNLVKVGTSCMSTCPAQTYKSNNICLQCPQFAATCNSLIDVTSCIPNYFKFQGQCTNQCGQGYYLNTTTASCSSCHPYCKTCTDATYSSCPLCADNAFQVSANKCQLGCADGTFQNSLTKLCVSCKPECFRCVDATSCSQCQDNFYLQGVRCVSKCDPGYYPVDALQYEVATIDNQPDMFIVYYPYCKKCNSACLDCYGEFNYQCTSCALTYTSNPKVIDGQVGFECLDICPNGKYASVGACLTCPATCGSCSSQTYCLSCLKGYLTDGQCVTTCPIGTYPNLITMMCQQCAVGCASCTGSLVTQCPTCTTGYYSYGNSCVNQCPNNTYKQLNACQNCLQNCLTCANGNSCLSCSSRQFLYMGLCQPNCPTQYYGNNMNVCIKCNPACSSCSGSLISQCYGCNEGFQLADTTCSLGCRDGYYLDTLQKCQACAGTCSKCVSATLCSACQPNFFLQDGFCVGKCATTSYLDVPLNTCMKCFSSCATCSGMQVNQCLSCPINLYFYASTCVSACPDRYYADNKNQVCQVCNSQCATCMNPTSCTKCVAGLYLMKASGSCLASCSIGYFNNLLTSECGTCDSSCVACVGPLNSNCQSCAQGNLLTLTTCSAGCIVGQYLANGKCSICSPQCKTCSNANDCLSCTSGFFLSGTACITQCPVKTFGNKLTWTCDACDSTCQTCADASKSSCLTCPVPLLFDLGMCLAQCPAKTFSNKVSCVPCQASCATCVDLLGCQTCISGLQLQGTTCQQNCRNGYYADPNSICQMCNPACATCTGRLITTCTSCNVGWLLTASTCIPGCIPGFFLQDQQCLQCHSTCNQCTSLTTCTVCANGYFLQNKLMCVVGSACGLNLYANTKTETCDSCAANCATCLGSLPNQCQTCVTPYLYSINSCVKDCPLGQFKLNALTCGLCNPDCSACTSATVCLSCVAGRVLENSVCKNSCDPANYVNVQTQTCYKCQVGCAACDNGDTCIRADLGYILNTDRRPIPGCVNGFFLQNGVCQACPPSCTTCSSLTVCTICATNFYLQVATCGATCPNGTYPNSKGICSVCSTGCATCTNTNNCPTCLNGFFQYNSGCVADCPLGFYVKSNACTKCSSTCTTCSDAVTCTSCSLPLVLQGITCLTACNQGYFELNDVCKQCYSNCATCVGGLLNQCSSCNDGFIILPSLGTNGLVITSSANTCTPGCIVGKFLSGGKCLQCATNCAHCDSLTNCQVPTSPYFVYGGLPTLTCPNGHYGSLVTRECKLCDATCATCLGGSLSQCLTCVNTLILNINTCVTQCPNGRFNNQGKCSDCLANCATCQDITKCTTCGNGLVLQSGVCLVKCDASYFQNTNQVCQACNPACSSCTGTGINQCLACNEGYLLHGVTCLPGCQDGHYLSNGKCPLCSSTCATCDNSLTCLSCAGLFYLKASQCTLDCGDNHYKNTLAHECQKCYLTCSSCTSPEKNACNTCEPTFYLQTQQCLVACQDGYYALGFICQTCDASCLSCNAAGPKACTQCPTNSYLSLGSCVKSCPPSQYGNSRSHICQNCSPACSSCTAADAGSCSVCNEGFLLTLTTCTAGCVQGYYLDSGKCLPCQVGCSVCTGALQCTQCVHLQYLFKSQCTATCQAGYYGASNGQCEVCKTGCATCTDGNNCQSCTLGYLQDDASCVQSCGKGKYANLNKCSLCAQGCGTCVNGTDCVSCALGLTLQGVACLTKCNVGYYTFNQVCSVCNGACTACTGALISQCTGCNDGYLLIGTTCQPGCVDGRYLSNMKCSACPSQCTLCGSATNCASCAPGFFLSGTSCLATCPDGYYGDVASKKCVACSAQCTKCTAGSPDSCSACLTPFLFNAPSSCVQQCPSSTYVDTKKTCQKCDASCGECIDQQTCTACNKPLALYNSKCNTACPPVMYINIDNVCKSCNPACTSCTGPSLTLCGGCVEGYLLQAKTNCVVGCVDGKYLSQGKCLTCSTNCAICSGATTCTTCASTYFLDQGVCILTCPNGSYGANGVCLKCDPTCTKCTSGAPNSCQSCVDGHLLSGSTCVNQCPSGQYQSNTVCNTCDTDCLQCTNTKQCTKCSGVLVSMGGVCVASCSDAYYNNQGLCSPCDTACSRCTGSAKNSCQACRPGYLLKGTACEPGCLGGFYLANMQCIQCSQGCADCGGPNQCTSCIPSLFLLNNNCISSCPAGTYAYLNYCRRCNDACLQCTSGDNLSCSQCNAGYYQYNTQCLLLCPTGTFSQIITPQDQIQSDTYGRRMLQTSQMTLLVCTVCPSNCVSCSQTYQCTVCQNGLFLQNGACLTQCSNGYYAGDKVNCIPCDSSCSSCTGPLVYNMNTTTNSTIKP